MILVVKLHPEITVKSRSVRKRYTALLQSNIRRILKSNTISVDVRNHWDRLTLLVHSKHQNQLDQIIQLLACIPGIHQIHHVIQGTFKNQEDLGRQVCDLWRDKLSGKHFVVRVKRTGEYSFSSVELAAYVGSCLLECSDSLGVDLKQPDVTIQLSVTESQFTLAKEQYAGLGGMPIPTQDDVLALISGGFDSGVASYQMIRRGARTHYVFF